MILRSILRGPLALWYCCLVNSEEYLHQQLKENKYFPFQLQQPKGKVFPGGVGAGQGPRVRLGWG